MGIKVEEVDIVKADGTVIKCGGRKVLEDFVCHDGEVITEDFVFDGASVPRIFSRIVAKFKYLYLSGRHDWDCKKVRELKRLALKRLEVGDVLGYDRYMKKAKLMRSTADGRYGKGLSKADNTVSGHVAWAGVRIGSFFGVGW